MKPIRITELGTMATCERKWWYRYGDPEASHDDESSIAMTKGTLVHAMWGDWWMNRGGVDATRVMDAIPEDRRELITEEIMEDAVWLMGRYAQVYGPHLDEWEMVENEVELKGVIDGLDCEGRADGLIRHVESGRLFLAECKTMRDWRRLDILTVDPQITHYWTLARAMGHDIDGVLYDAIRTYRWKRDEHKHPPEETVRRLFIDRTIEQSRMAADELHAFHDRRLALTQPSQGNQRKTLPLRHIDAQTCSWCSFRPRCWEELAFPNPEPEIELVD